MKDRKNTPLDKSRLACEDVQVVVLMGGMGARLKEQTMNIPKPLVEVQGKPFFEYEMELLLRAGFRRFLFLVGYKSEMMKEYFGDGSRYREKYGAFVSIRYSYDGEKLLGTAGAIVKALPMIEEDFMLCYADSFMDVDYFEIIYRYFVGKQAGKKAVMTVMENGNRFDKSNVYFKDGEILMYDKKNPTIEMKHIDYGIEVFDRSVFEVLPKGESLDLADIQNSLVADGLCEACEETHRFYEIGTPESLKEFQKYSDKRFHQSHVACFVDRDGVINEIVFHEDAEQLDSAMSVGEFKFINGAVDGLKKMSDAGIDIYIVTNQPAAAKGKTTLAQLYDINRYMVRELELNGIHVSGIKVCPHHPRGDIRAKERFLIQDCSCRKPKPGMLSRILEFECIDKSQSYMVGDSYTDILAGKAAGLLTAFVGDYKCDVCSKLKYQKPDMVGKNLLEIAEKIIAGKYRHMEME